MTNGEMNMRNEDKLKKLKLELNELRIKASPINTAIWLKESEIYNLEEEMKESNKR
jgi:hypothetical protein